MTELQRMLGLRPHPVRPSPAAPAWLAAPSAVRVRQPLESPGFAPEPDEGGLDDDDADYDEADDYQDDYDQDDYDEDDYDQDDGFESTGDLSGAWRGKGAARRPARSRNAPPLGSYESRQAALRRPRRHQPFRVVLLAVMVLGAVGVSAVKFLALPDTRLAISGAQDSPAATASALPPSAASANTAGTTALTSFATYPGQQTRDGGQLAVNSVAVANGAALAVGSADGHPAIWRPGPGSSWALADGAVNGPLAGRPGNQTLTAVTDGPAGWLAVGAVVSGAREHPVVVTSADGQTWRTADGSPAFGGAGLYAYGAAAGRLDYVIVGGQVTGNTLSAVTWWSAGLGTWNRGGIGGMNGSGKPSVMFAVTAGAQKFIAVGADGSQPAVWTSPNGHQWMAADLPLPAGATRAVLRQVISTGRHVVATGEADTPSGAVAFAAVSGDDGTTWHEVPLPAPGSQAAVTALAASSNGFVAAGLSGRSGASSAVVWTSANGMNWASARAVPGPSGGKVQAITGLASTGREVKGIGVATTKTGASAVLYTAPTP